jgi:hypothetical protein
MASQNQQQQSPASAPPPPAAGDLAAQGSAASAAAAAAHARALHRADMLAQLRALPSSAYVAMATAEAVASAVVFSPALLVLFTLDGVMYARNPVVPPGHAPPPRPQTFGGLLAAGFKSGASMTLRSVGWAGGAAGLAALGKEALSLGPRHQDGRDAVTGRDVTLVHAAAGALAGFAVSADFPMVRQRRVLYTLLAASCGAAMPAVLAAAGPYVRAQLAAVGVGPGGGHQ